MSYPQYILSSDKHGLSGCRYSSVVLDLGGNTKTELDMKWPRVENLLFGCICILVGIIGLHPILNGVWMY